MQASVLCGRGAHIVGVGLLCGALALPAWASDHIDGEETKTDPLADLSDFYAFPSEGGTKLSLILNTYPIAPSGAHFSSRIGYTFELRSAAFRGGAIDVSDGMRIECRFASEDADDQAVTCTSDTGLTATAARGLVSPDAPMKLFFDRRSDPFFFDSDWATATSTSGAIPDSQAENTMASLNVLSLAVQLDRDALPGGMLALAVEAWTEDGGTRRFLDRIGRPEITNVTLIHRGDAEDIRDTVNREPAFDMSDTAIAKKATRLGEAIAYYDALDGQTDWVGAAQLVDLLQRDFLLLDLDRACTGDAFFAIERAVLDGAAHDACGGRKPGDDIIDKLYTLYVANDREPVGDKVDAPHRAVSAEFPHLAPPVTGFWSWFKTWLGNRRAR